MYQVITKAEEELDKKFKELQSRHRILYQKVNQDIAENQRENYLTQANQLINDIEDFIPDIALIDEYIWVNQVALQWQTVFSSILNDSRDVRHEIQSLAAQRTQLAASSPKVYSRQDLEVGAYYLGRDRKIRELFNNPDLLFRHFPSKPEDKEEDWVSVCTYLSLDILEGKLDFFSGIQPGLYEALEYAWLEDAKRYKAYFEWQQNDQNWNSEESIRQKYYFKACDQLSRRFLDVYSKLSVRCFKNIKDHLKNQYFTDGTFDLDKAKKLIELKAYRLWERDKNSDPFKNWSCAEQYVQEFYSNIIAAVEEHDANSIDCISKLFQWSESPENLHYLINCFEAAIAIHFIEIPQASKLFG